MANVTFTVEEDPLFAVMGIPAFVLIAWNRGLIKDKVLHAEVLLYNEQYTAGILGRFVAAGCDQRETSAQISGVLDRLLPAAEFTQRVRRFAQTQVYPPRGGKAEIIWLDGGQTGQIVIKAGRKVKVVAHFLQTIGDVVLTLPWLVRSKVIGSAEGAALLVAAARQLTGTSVGIGLLNSTLPARKIFVLGPVADLLPERGLFFYLKMESPVAVLSVETHRHFASTIREPTDF